jgi:hypothetical protein
MSVRCRAESLLRAPGYPLARLAACQIGTDEGQWLGQRSRM